MEIWLQPSRSYFHVPHKHALQNVIFQNRPAKIILQQIALLFNTRKRSLLSPLTDLSALVVLYHGNKQRTVWLALSWMCWKGRGLCTIYWTVLSTLLILLIPSAKLHFKLHLTALITFFLSAYEIIYDNKARRRSGFAVRTNA